MGGRPGWLTGWLTWAGLFCPQALQDASVLIFANKQDVKDSMSPAEISQFLTLSAIKEHPWHIQGCCALTGEGSVPHLSLAWPSQWVAGYRNPSPVSFQSGCGPQLTPGPVNWTQAHN